MNFISSHLNWKLVVFSTCACIVACIVAFIVGIMCVVGIMCIVCIAIACYIFLFYCTKTMDDCNVFFHEYNHETRMVLNKYGDFKISNAYLIMNPISKIHLFILNLITRQNCQHIIDDVLHMQLMVEIKLNKHKKKMILIDKVNCINVSTDFHIHDTSIIYKIKMKHEHTLRGVLDETCDRIGKFKFFNWHFYKNNCQYFIKQLVLFINPDFKIKCFKSEKKFKQVYDKMFYHTFILYIAQSLFIFYNFFKKYLNALKMKLFA